MTLPPGLVATVLGAALAGGSGGVAPTPPAATESDLMGDAERVHDPNAAEPNLRA